ncbi:MAG: Biotin carboxyl carrier protein of acetyl-CoA carboxylase [Chlamydiales bacterium]|nr:Biotin carboxyl carrier protein of acetyl-CoA carboxylase [Chlamydiales bacterium]MCH9634893.1 Biotin carboxyl carrier protein of acetyl-CoA carboxylase [Chlamydiales bacterium]MCH9704041.1 acetyl-CoA carboxylase biotin carboxyl carrier protein [Chlamydiota bacterium]
MDIKEIDDLIGKMEKRGLTRLAIKKGGFELELERGGCAAPVMAAPVAAPVAAEPAAAAAPKKSGKEVTSPIVGTFYAAPSPDDAPYAKVGDMVEPESVVCIVEAMKVMNEVKAGVRGKIVEILVKNGDPVEFGTAIFRVE